MLSRLCPQLSQEQNQHSAGSAREPVHSKIKSCRFVEYAMKMAEDDRDLVIQDYLDKDSKFSKAAGRWVGVFVKPEAGTRTARNEQG